MMRLLLILATLSTPVYAKRKGHLTEYQKNKNAAACAENGLVGKAKKVVQELSSTKDFDSLEKFKKNSAAYRAKHKREPLVGFETFEQARNYVQKFPAFRELGFNVGGPGWERYIVSMESSGLYGKAVGWKRKLPNGDSAHYRLDFDPDGRGAHFNIEIRSMGQKGQRETHKLAVQFKCGGEICSEAQTKAFLSSFAP